jgi:hypothetical protein
MPQHRDIHKIRTFSLASNTIKQGCEFYYSGTQARKTIKKKWYKIKKYGIRPRYYISGTNWLTYL